jgi:hypothetical protein
MSEKEAIKHSIEQCRRVMGAAMDPITLARLREWLAELEDRLAKLSK